MDDFGIHTPLMITGGQLFSSLNVGSTPTTVVVDKNGNILEKFVGRFPEDEILSHIE